MRQPARTKARGRTLASVPTASSRRLPVGPRTELRSRSSATRKPSGDVRPIPARACRSSRSSGSPPPAASNSGLTRFRTVSPARSTAAHQRHAGVGIEVVAGVADEVVGFVEQIVDVSGRRGSGGGDPAYQLQRGADCDPVGHRVHQGETGVVGDERLHQRHAGDAGGDPGGAQPVVTTGRPAGSTGRTGSRTGSARRRRPSPPRWSGRAPG